MLISKLIKPTLMMIILGVLLVGCSSEDNSSNKIPEKISYEIKSTMNNTNDIHVKKFNLGSTTFEERGKTIPFDKEGIIAIPKDLKDNAPVVFVFHGRHSDKEKTDFEDGFKYLVEDLAKNGIIGISVDSSINYTFKYGEPVENERLVTLFQEHLNSLKLANKGSDVGYGYDLNDKVDLDNIGLIGHSVAGSGVFKIASNQIKNDSETIKGIIAVAPAYNAIIDNFPDVTSSLIVSEYDGDVMHAGADLYEDILKKHSERENPLGLTYLFGGNHNGFNSVLSDKEFSTPPTTNGTYPGKISPEKQRDFLSNYSVDFMKSVFNIGEDMSPIFIKNKVTPSKLYGYEVVSKIYYNDTENIFDEKDFKNVNISKVESEIVTESYIPEKDSIGVFRTIEYAEKLNLLKLDWKNKGSSVSIPLKTKDLSKFSQIGLSFALNSPSELNSVDKEVVFDISLVDNNGKESVLNISNNNISSLKYINGEIVVNEYVDGMYHNYWSRPTPISYTNIPLNLFDNIDLSNVKYLKINFNNTESGSLIIDKVMAIK